MKKSLKIGLVVAMLAFSTAVAVFGSELPVNVVASGKKSVNLYFGEIEGKVWISLYDQAGHVFHSKRLKDIESYAMQYDLNDLPDGTYVLALERVDQAKNVKLVINNGKVTVDNNYVSRPLVSVSTNKVTVEMKHANEAIWNISIEDLERNIVFQGIMEGAAPKRTYDLSSLPAGEYIFELNAKGNAFIERIVLKK